MFKALAQELKISLSGDEEWDAFIRDINSLNCRYEKWFNDVFDKYF